MFGIILSAVILFIVLLLFSYVRIYVVYEDALKAYLRLFGIIKLRLYPAKAPERYISAKKMKALGRKSRKKSKPRSAKRKNKEEESVSKGIAETVEELYRLVSVILKRFAYKVKIRVRKLDIRVATDDAAKTALVYAAVCNSLTLLTELITGFDKLKCSIDSMDCRCDFVADSFSMETDIEIKIRIHNVLLSVMGVIVDTLNNK